MYAYDCKIIANISNEEDARKMQEDLNATLMWTEIWLMWLNYDKCKAMHMGKRT